MTTKTADKTAAKATPAKKAAAPKVPAQTTKAPEPVATVRRGAARLRFTYKTVTVQEWLTMVGVIKDGKVYPTACPEAAYQRGREPYTNAKKKQQLTHIGEGGVFPALTVWMPNGELREVINGQQRTHSYGMWMQALMLREHDSEAIVSPVIETATSALIEKGVEPITLAELSEMPITLEIVQDDATEEEREELFLKRGTTEIAIKTEHMADLAQAKLLEVIGSWGIGLATSKERTDASGGKTDAKGIKSITVIEAVHAYVAGSPEVSKAKMASQEDNAKIMAKLGDLKEIGSDLAELFNKVTPELHAKSDDYWGALKRENSTVFSAIAAALGYARSATTPSKVTANVKTFRKLLTGEGADPLNIKAMAGNMLSFYDHPGNNGKKKRDLMFHGFKALFTQGVPQGDETGVPVHPIRWDLAAKEAGITV